MGKETGGGAKLNKVLEVSLKLEEMRAALATTGVVVKELNGMTVFPQMADGTLAGYAFYLGTQQTPDEEEFWLRVPVEPRGPSGEESGAVQAESAATASASKQRTDVSLMTQLIHTMAESLVDFPRDLTWVVEEKPDNHLVFRVTAGREDIGKLIGANGRNARAMRTVMLAASRKVGLYCELDIKERGNG